MNRRNVLLGLGTAAAGSGVMFGSGAFTQVQASRDFKVDVKNDTNASVKIAAGTADEGFATVNLSGGTGNSLQILLDDESINRDATLTVGDVDTGGGEDPTSDESNTAFYIQDETSFTADNGSAATDSLGITVDITDTDSTALTATFAGDSNDSGLTTTDAATDGGSTGTNFNSNIDNVADSSSKAKFLLNGSSNSDISDTAAAQLDLDTSGSGSEAQDGKIEITAELVPDITSS